VAVALRVHNDVELLIATNANVSPTTLNHLETLWRTLQQLSIESEVQNREELIRRECLKFAWERLQGIDSEGLFMRVFGRITRLEAFYTRLDRPDSDQKWRMLWYFMKATERIIDAFLNDGGLHADDLWRLKDAWNYQQWFRKLASITKDIEVIMGAANSPKCKGIFAKRFKVTPVKMTLTTRNDILRTSQQWRNVVENALKTRNDNRSEYAEELELHAVVVEQDLATMRSVQHWAINNQVHCEVRLLTFIYNQEMLAHSPMPHAYTYIGTSKLSCRGCQIFIQAFNKVHHTKFIVKGQHHKAYYPWEFPKCHNSDEVAKEMYVLCNKFGDQYHGFRPKLADFNADSEAQTLSSGQNPKPTDKEVKIVREIMGWEIPKLEVAKR